MSKKNVADLLVDTAGAAGVHKILVIGGVPAGQPRGLALMPLALGLSASSAAAASSPSIDVLGSYFPAWLLCIVVGVVLAMVARLVFIAWKIDRHLLPAPILYPCLIAVFAMTVWLIFFQN